MFACSHCPVPSRTDQKAPGYISYSVDCETREKFELPEPEYFILELKNTFRGSFSINKWDLIHGWKDGSVCTNQSMYGTTLKKIRIKIVCSSQKMLKNI